MSPNNVCPSCGAALEDNVGSACPYCGSALSLSMSAPTIISAPAKKKKVAKSSAEAMDEVKQLVREGDKAAAAEVASAEFGLNQEAAKNTVEQVATDMKTSAVITPVAKPILEPSNSAFYTPASSKPAMSANFTTETNGSKKTISGRWAITCGTGGVILLCMCCCGIPILLTILGLISKTR
jgi:hypothetical protein